MDKTVVLAVAGSGKTSYIIDNTSLDKRILLLTYTINNYNSLKERIINKFGYFPDNIDLYTYYPFLYSFCFSPFLGYKIKPKGIYWDHPPRWTSRKKRSSLIYYLSKDGRLYHNRIARLLKEAKVLKLINKRLEKYYDVMYVDEVQDFAGHDFNLLKSILKADLKAKLVGDFFQHTFDTSRDGNTNKNLHQDYGKYQEEFESIGVTTKKEELDKSWRCSPTVCSFISDEIKIQIDSHKSDDTIVKYISSEVEADRIFQDDSIVKLFYREHYRYNCYSKNWGGCKGENKYQDVCVVLNKTSMKLFTKNELHKLKPVSKNKLYVACSRAHRNLLLVSEELFNKYKT